MSIRYINYGYLAEKYTMEEAAKLIGVPVDFLWDECVDNEVFLNFKDSETTEICKSELCYIHNIMYHKYR